MKESTTDSLLPLKDIQVPNLPEWFPVAWGWWATLGAILLTLALVMFLIRRNKKRLAPKKTALRLLKPGHGRVKPSAAIELVRQAALCYYPREDIALLTGEQWYQFLDRQWGREVFVNNYELWQQALYQRGEIDNAEELVEHCYQWVEENLPPKKGRR
ncbi:DUF4381 domain-containing protein [Vibrio sp.]|uniref:DUF4381 domain-containing protein n=1 Tax=Vibrio sp. TaxID=678 RepID=UPI003D103ACD